MYSKAKIANHPIHPMLVGFPITFYLLTFVAFIVYETISKDIFWFKLGYFSNYAAIATALVAAIPGFIDWAIGIPKETAAKARGLVHMALNLATLALYCVNAVVIRGSWNRGHIGLTTTLFLTAVGCGIVVVAGYLGWEMIGHHKVGVELTPEQERLQSRVEYEEPPIFH